MSALARELLRELAAEARADPALAAELALALAPYLPATSADGWLDAPGAAEYLGLGSLTALDRLVRDGGLGCAQPSGPGGRRYFRRAELDRYLGGGA